jgi:glycosyltransferase involved in cell wall biosynthesis
MRIIYLHQYFKFPDENGGTRSYDLASSFNRKGYEVTIVTTTSDEKYNNKRRWTQIEKEGIKVNYIYLPYKNDLSYLQRSMVFLNFLLFSSIKLFNLKADLVLATSTPLTIGIPALMKKWLHKTPFVFEVRDVWPEAVIAIGAIKNKFLQNILFFLEKSIYKNAETIIPLSTDMQNSIILRYPNFKSKTSVVIENISEINRFQVNKSSINLKKHIGLNPRFSILYAGAFGKVNRLDKVVDYAVKTLPIDKGLVYILIGEGSEKKNVIDLAKRKKVLNQNLFILDSVAKSDLPLWYNSVSMGSSFVANIPELWSNSANKLFDTLAANRPILINYKGWQSKVIKKKNIGYVLPFSLTSKAAIEFVNYTMDINLIKIQSENALKTAEKSYSLKIAAKKYIEIFEKASKKCQNTL